MAASAELSAGQHMPFRILLVDDDASLVFTVRTGLQLAGYEVFTAGNGREALNSIDRFGLPHLAIVDIRMPIMDGLTFCERVQRFADLPIVLLTAVDTEDVVADAISRFAEDYVVKPFSQRLLEVRVARVLRRIGSFAYALQPTIQVDERLSIDFAHQEALVAGTVVPLTGTETKLLYLLMRNAGHAVTTNFLARRLWAPDDIPEESLRVHVFNLRRKLEADPQAPQYVVTERGLGYRFVAPHRLSC